ncbi:hypothetical protein F2Q68_00038533 [Brassica cretica]|uniref:Uncharacterized protein n=1 Tax=Brassica cretica TaxID=69181 RepID=A0A8S9MFU5_BRACR|nr:hypothetical protein F2Q68_00038533 [Brassica cretica]
MRLRLRLNAASSCRSPKKSASAIKTLRLILSSPSPTFELSHLHLQPSSSLISISDAELEISLLRRRLSRALSSLKLITSSLISDGYHELSHLCLSRALLSPPILGFKHCLELEASLTRARSPSSSSISGSVHLSCLSLSLEFSGMMFDGFCSLSQSIVVLSFVHVWVREFLLHKAHVFVGFCYGGCFRSELLLKRHHFREEDNCTHHYVHEPLSLYVNSYTHMQQDNKI